MRFTPKGTGSHLRCEVEFGAVVPGIDRLVRLSLLRSIRATLPKVDAAASLPPQRPQEQPRAAGHLADDPARLREPGAQLRVADVHGAQ